MHYKNGREAKNGDKVVLLPTWGVPVIGILYDAVAGNDHCNGHLAPIRPGDPCPDLKECLHLDDVLSAVAAKTKTVWLIERKIDGRPHWWSRAEWTPDAAMAVWFVRECDASDGLAFMSFQDECRITEHMFI